MTGCFQGGAVVQRLSSRNKYDAIREVIQKAPVFSQINDKKKIEEAVIQREQILSTGLGRGVAVAHGTTSSVERILIALGISEQGINFDAIDRAPVHLLFVITTPPHCKMEYLITLAAVTRLIRDEGFRQSLYQKITTRELEKKLFDAYHVCLKKYEPLDSSSGDRFGGPSAGTRVRGGRDGTPPSLRHPSAGRPNPQ